MNLITDAAQATEQAKRAQEDAAAARKSQAERADRARLIELFDIKLNTPVTDSDLVLLPRRNSSGEQWAVIVDGADLALVAEVDRGEPFLAVWLHRDGELHRLDISLISGGGITSLAVLGRVLTCPSTFHVNIGGYGADVHFVDYTPGVGWADEV